MTIRESQKLRGEYFQLLGVGWGNFSMSWRIEESRQGNHYFLLLVWGGGSQEGSEVRFKGRRWQRDVTLVAFELKFV
jgi:hypothetical protein